MIQECELIDFTEIFNKICSFVGVKFASTDENADSALAFSKLLKEFWPKKYKKEVIGAYFFATKGQLLDLDNNVIKVFPMVDIRTCSDYINAFDRFFNKSFEQEMKSQRFFYDRELNAKKETDQKELYESFKRSLQVALDMVKDGREFSLPGSDIFIYDTLKDLGVINLSQEEKEFEINNAYNELKSKWNAERVSGASIGRRMELGVMIESLMPEDIRVLNQAKRNFLGKQLKIWVEFGSTVEEIIS